MTSKLLLTSLLILINLGCEYDAETNGTDTDADLDFDSDLITNSEIPDSEEQLSFEREFDISQLTSSNLPLMIIENQGEVILDEPKILSKMWLINSTGGNTLDDNLNLDYGYDEDHLFAGIETRGASSQKFEKKQYSLELWLPNNGADLHNYPIGTTEDFLKEEDAIDDQAASLVAMPEEEDWILNAPFADKTLMRNYFAYSLAADLTGRWQPRAKFIELLLKNINELDYRGVYLLVEKIKRDSNRVDINKLKEDEISGEDLTGGYILELTSPFRVDTEDPVIIAGNRVFAIEYPKAEDLQAEQYNYIKNYIDAFLEALYSEESEDDIAGYSAFVDINSLVDFFLFNQLLKNTDAFTLSTYFHKDKNGLLIAGPLWDFNLTGGNGNFSSSSQTSSGSSYKDWAYTRRLISEQLFLSPKFIALYQQRWSELRASILTNEEILSRIDTAMNLLKGGPADRNYQKWDVFGSYLQGNEIAGSENHGEEVAYFRQWMLNRMAWIDSNIGDL